MIVTDRQKPFLSAFLLSAALVLALFFSVLFGACKNVADSGVSDRPRPEGSVPPVDTSSLRGINHGHAWYSSRLEPSLSGIRSWGANAVRVVLSNGHRYGKTGASEVRDILQAAWDLGFSAVILEVHDTTGYGEDAAACSLAEAARYWKELAAVLGDWEDFAVVNLGNEPFGNNGTDAWARDTKAAVAVLREAGIDNTLLADAPNWGQDWSGTMRQGAPEVLAADPLGKTLFSVHMYGVYDTEAKVRDYLSSFHDRGIPLVIGEFGNRHSDEEVAEEAIVAWAREYGMGYFAWSWCGNGGGVEYLDLVSAWDPSKPTSWGSWFRDYGLGGL